MTELAVRPDLNQIAIPGVELSYTALVVTDPELAFDSFASIIRAGTRIHSAAKFWVGDALEFGELVYGESYAQAVEATGLSYSYLTNIRSVCRKVHRDRRREGLSFSHHAEVARLDPELQAEWLDAALENGWSVDDFRSRLRDACPPPPRGEQPQWAGQEPLSAEPLTQDEVDAAAANAKRVEEQKLPATHPLWETHAKALARDVQSLAATAAQDVVIVPEATSLRVAAENVVGGAWAGKDGDWHVPEAAFTRLAEALKNTE